MLAELDVAEYLQEIRDQVCSRCVERPPGGPPCEPLGKQCGVELHLPQLIESIHEVHSPAMGPYVEHNRAEICEHCALLHTSVCPCPMDYLSTLIVEAVERVDRRRDLRDQANRFIGSLPEFDEIGLEEIESVYENATGAWIGCDWPTQFGLEGLNLQGMTSAQAATIAAESPAAAAGIWRKAATWLADVERYAARAEKEASLGVATARVGEWRQALQHARRAWAWEFSTGRSFRNHGPRTWLNFTLIVDQAARANQPADT
jgi:hypothetical protein